MSRTYEERLAYNRAWRAEHREHVNKQAVEYRVKKPKKALLVMAKSRARLRGLEFSITENDIELPVLCPVLGLPLKINAGVRARDRDSSYSLDRIDNSKGYVPGNVQVISQKANMMKGSASIDELLLLAKWVQKQYG